MLPPRTSPTAKIPGKLVSSKYGWGARGQRESLLGNIVTKESHRGPLLDLQGRVLGVNSYPGLQGYDVPGLTLAIPSNIIQKIVPKLISQHSYEHIWLGLDVTDLTNFVVVNHHYGAVVQDVDPDSPAAKIGIKGLEPNLSSISDPFIIHDIITAINGSPIKNSSDFYNYIIYIINQ
jgi:S1-C subfamily serine protease